MKNDLNSLKIKISELKKQIEEEKKKISKEGISLADNDHIRRNIKEIQYLEEFIDLNTMKDCTHIYVMGEDEQPFCFKCGLDSLYKSFSNAKTMKQMNIYSICQVANSHLPYGIPKGEFLTVGDQVVPCSREVAYSIYQDIVSENPDIDDDTLKDMFIEQLPKEEKKKQFLKK